VAFRITCHSAETCVSSTTAKGDIAEQAIVLALMKAGKTVLRPVSNGLRYDLVVDNLDGTFARIQCKTGTLKCDRGVIRFRPRSADARRPNGVPYHGQIDMFGVYCPQNGQVYFVPIEDLGTIEPKGVRGSTAPAYGLTDGVPTYRQARLQFQA
jgi:hypothetical protein